MRRAWFWGIFFVCAAAFVILGAMGMLEGVSAWTIILVALLGALIIQGIIHMEFCSIFIPLAVICILFDKQLGMENLTPWPVLAAALFLSIGFSILFRNAARRYRRRYKRDSAHNYCNASSDTHNDNASREKEATWTITDDNLSHSVKFGASTKYLRAEQFKHVQFDCSFGALKVYFDQATPHPDGAEVLIDCSFGEVELFIPRQWNIVNRIDASIGAVNNPQNTGNGATLTLLGAVRFGSVKIVYI